MQLSIALTLPEIMLSVAAIGRDHQKHESARRQEDLGQSEEERGTHQ